MYTSILIKRTVLLFKGKEIIEYYLKQLEEEGVTHIPRWTPIKYNIDHGGSYVRRPLSSPVNVPGTAIKEALNPKEMNTCNNASDPTVGTPDGALLDCLHSYFMNSAIIPWSPGGTGMESGHPY